MKYAKCHYCRCEWDSLDSPTLKRELDSLGWTSETRLGWQPGEPRSRIWVCPRCPRARMSEWRTKRAPPPRRTPQMTPQEAQTFLDDLAEPILDRNTLKIG